jgi:5,6-dimethylbenzimidazole synthase
MDMAFSAVERSAVYRAIFERRDMRHFAGGTVAPDVMRRLLTAAHHAPSVGFMQPWRFLRIASTELRTQLHELVEQERVLTARALGEREDAFIRLKVEGLREAAELWGVALADGREKHIFGRRTLPQMDLASAACAIQNLWLAARAEGLGLGAGCPCSTRPRWPACWACSKGLSPSPCCAWVPSSSFTPNPCCSRPTGPGASRWSRWCLRTTGGRLPVCLSRMRPPSWRWPKIEFVSQIDVQFYLFETLRDRPQLHASQASSVLS